MTYAYDHSFAPFVFADRVVLDREALPDLAWVSRVVAGQLRGAVVAGYQRVAGALPERLRGGLAGRALHGAFRRVIPPIPGAVATVGDAEFAWQRFAGINPMTVRAARTLDDLPTRLRLSDAEMASLLGTGATLAQRIAQGDVFVQTYDELRSVTEASLQRGRFVSGGNVLFCRAPEMDAAFEVIPLAIECPSNRPDGLTELVTPRDGARWEAARQMISVADLHVAELCVHLALGHNLVAPFALALRRRLPRGHALRDLLLPHLRYNVFIDHMAWRQGVRSTDGVLITTLGGTASWCHDIARARRVGRTFREMRFEADLRARGLDEHPVEYPYRDDARLVRAALARWVTRWVQWAYPTDASIAHDRDLHAFFEEVGAPDRGNLPGVFEGPRVSGRDELASTLAELLFWGGPFHAMAHYALSAHLEAADANPAYLLRNPLASPVVDLDTARGTAMHKGQLARAHATHVRFGRLGDYEGAAITRHAALATPLADLRRDLDEVEQVIVARNAQRFLPFVHLLPSRLANGVTL